MGRPVPRAKPDRRLPISILNPATFPSRDEAMAAVRTLLAWAGDNPDREGLLDTPQRVVDAYGEWFAGYEGDPAKELSAHLRGRAGL